MLNWLEQNKLTLFYLFVFEGFHSASAFTCTANNYHPPYDCLHSVHSLSISFCLSLLCSFI